MSRKRVRLREARFFFGPTVASQVDLSKIGQLRDEHICGGTGVPSYRMEERRQPEKVMEPVMEPVMEHATGDGECASWQPWLLQMRLHQQHTKLR